MQTLDLARAAADAEVLRIKRLLRRQAVRAAFGAVAAVFVLGVLIWVQIVIFEAFLLIITPLEASAVVLAVDLVIAGIFGFLAARSTPDAVEAEAKLLRNQSLSAMKESLAVATLLGPVGKLAVRAVGRKRATGLTLAALAATFLSGRR